MWADLRCRLRTLLRRSAVERELDDELRFHLERHVQKYVDAGYARSDAVRRARLEFGGLEQLKEQCRDARGVGFVDEVSRNLRYAWRSLVRRPLFAVVAILTLGFGIGANTAVFSAVDAILLRPLPFPDGDRLVQLQQYEPNTASPPTFVAPARLEDWQRLNTTFQVVSGYYTDDISETSGELPERLSRAWVAPRFFEVWSVVPALGRPFTPEEERFGGPSAVVISDRLWKRRFGSNPDIVGQRLRVGRQSYPIVGVMPASFRLPLEDVDLWASSPPDAPYARSRASTWFTVIGRLKAGITLSQAQADVDRVQAQLGEQYPATDGPLAVRLRPLKNVVVGDTGRSLWMLFAAVSLLLTIACTNIAALQLARNADRQSEIAIRRSLGASRSSIIRQLLSEAFVLAGAGSVIGLIVAAAALRAMAALSGSLPRISEVRLDWTTVAYSLGCAGAATLLFGLVPACRLTGDRMGGSLASGRRALTPSTARLQSLLVSVQVALAVTLLFGAGLLLRSFDALARVSPGFEADHVLTFRITGNWGETVDMEALRQRLSTTLASLRALPGIEAAATAVAAPGLPFEYETEVRLIEGSAHADDKTVAASRFVSGGYFSTLRIPLVAGEPCGDRTTPATAVVNQTFASLYLAGAPAVGRHIEPVPSNPIMPARIVGVAADAREQGLDREPGPIVYWCTSAPSPFPLVLVRTRADAMSMADSIRRKIHELEPGRSVYDLAPLEHRLDRYFAENRLRTMLSSLFAGSALCLAAIGLYGTLSYVVSMRRREIGVRMAMGARPRDIASGFLRQGLLISLAGCLAGLWLAAAFGRTLSGMLYGISTLDTPTFAAVLLLMVITATVSSLWPALRAAHVDPIQVLRE